MSIVSAAPRFDVHTGAEGGPEKYFRNRNVFLAVFQMAPNFGRCPPDGRSLEAAHFWRVDPGVTIEQVPCGKPITDGSCHKTGAACVRHAGWADDRLKDNGEPYAALFGPVEAEFPPTPPAAEWIALIAAALRGSADRELATDFKGTIRFNGPACIALDRKSHYAGLSQQISGGPRWTPQYQVSKGKGRKYMVSLRVRRHG